MKQVSIKYYTFTSKNLVCQGFSARPEVLIAASLNVHVFWDVTPYHRESSSPFSIYYSSFKMLGTTHPTLQSHPKRPCTFKIVFFMYIIHTQTLQFCRFLRFL